MCYHFLSDYHGCIPYTGYALESAGVTESIDPAFMPLRTRKQRRKSRIAKRRRGFPRGASAHRMTRGTGT